MFSRYNIPTFTDIDECIDGTDGCPENSVCNNTIGSFECICFPGFVKNGSQCDGETYY